MMRIANHSYPMMLVLAAWAFVGCQSTNGPQVKVAEPVDTEEASLPTPPEDAPFNVARLDDPDLAGSEIDGEPAMDSWASVEYDPETVWDEVDQDAGIFSDEATDLNEVSEERLNAAALEFEFKVDETAGLRLDETVVEEVPESSEVVTTITILSSRVNGVVSIDGIVAGNTGDEITVQPGAIQVTVSAPGYGDKEIAVQAKPGVNTSKEVQMEPLTATVAN